MPRAKCLRLLLGACVPNGDGWATTDVTGDGRIGSGSLALGLDTGDSL